MQNVMRKMERHTAKTASGDNVMAREYVYPENGDPQMVYFVRVEGCVGKQGEVSEGEGDSWQHQWTGGERGGAEAIDGREEGGTVGWGFEALCPREDSSDDDYDSYDDNDYRNTLFTVSDSSGSDGDSNSDELPDSEESSLVSRSDAHSLTDGNIYALESDDSGSSWGEATR